MAIPARPLRLCADRIDLIEQGLLRFAEMCDFDVRRESVGGAPVWTVYDPGGGRQRQVRVLGLAQDNGERRVYFVPREAVGEKDGAADFRTDVDKIQSLGLEAFGFEPWPVLEVGEGSEEPLTWVQAQVDGDRHKIEALLNAVSDRAGWAWLGWDRYDPKPVQTPVSRLNFP